MTPKLMLICACLAGLSGCQFTGDQRLVGAWTTDRRSTSIPIFPFTGLNDRLKSGLDSSQLKMSADHSFVLTGLSQIGGTWSYKAGQVTLIPGKMQPSKQTQLEDQVLHLKVSRDFSTLTLDIPTPFGPIRVTLDKTA